MKPVHQIIMDHPDEAEVNSGPDVQGALGTTFRVRKQNGRWILLEKSINTGPTFFTACELRHNRPNQSLEPTAGRCEVHI
jgi:hypothetical protein